MQPAADSGVMPEGTGPAVRPQHRVLNGIVGVLIGHAAAARKAVEVGVVPAEEFLEGPPVTGCVGREQIGVTAIVGI
jgi:hypothetical protein